MVKERKFYDLLDVPEDASDSDLKKAYRKKALRLHPDKGGDPELFKEVTHAYEILSDPQKRSIYDTRGEAGLSESGGMGGMDPQDLFSQLFGGGGFFGGGPSRTSGPRKSKDLVHRVHVSLEDLYKGKTTKLALTRNVICPKCDGKGGKEGAVKQCGSCQGRGVKVTLRQMGPMIQQLQQPCDDCSGTGEIINNKDKCKTCNGRKVISEKKMLEVHIDKGMKGGQTITFHGESDQAPGVTPGDVIIVIEEKPHDRFKRNDNNLITDVRIDLLTALGGGQFTIKHLDDRALIVNIAPGEVIKHDALKVIHGQGMPSQRHHEPGDLFIKISVEWPDHIDPDKIPLLERVLPPRHPIPKFPRHIHLEEVELADVDPRQQHAMDEPMEEDEVSAVFMEELSAKIRTKYVPWERIDTMQCILVLIADALADHDERAVFFTTTCDWDVDLPYGPLFRALESQDDFVQMKAAQILTLLLSSGSVTVYSPHIEAFLRILASSFIQTSSPQKRDIAVQCLEVLLPQTEVRKAVWAMPTLIHALVDILKSNSGPQMNYQIAFCFWLLTFEQEVAEEINKKYGLIPVVVDIAQAAVKEKVIRVIIAMLKNLVSKAPSANLPTMLATELLPFCNNLALRKWSDEDIVEDIQYLQDELRSRFESLTTWDEYNSELMSGHLTWSPVHDSDTFWRMSIVKFNEQDCMSLKQLIQLLQESTDPVVLAVAAHDLGQYVKHYERGKKMLVDLGAKTRVMELMSHEDPNVRYQALKSVQALVSHPWQTL
ncbi:hypothetical protein EWM64_g7321 [Hericium alpestre]|uniref:J domain-containing protein n=1 Tax=Hericium alpestre TaxID=135208 RepID=A0A4Y9ZSB0_9AGAM|nr:hypothetical protein EWM64_g7321 [Hericium alpestre]